MGSDWPPSVTNYRTDHHADDENDEQEPETGHEELTRGVPGSPLPTPLGRRVTFFGRAFLQLPLCHVSSVTRRGHAEE